MDFSRRSALKALGLGAAATAVTGLKTPAVWAQSNMTKIRAGFVPILDSAALYAALDEGYFKAERLDVEATPTPGGGPSLSAVAAGQFQTGMATLTSVILGAAQGIDFRIVTAVDGVGSGPPNDSMALLVRKGSGIKTGADLTGKRVAVQLLNNLPWLCTRMWIDKTGGDSSKVNLVEVHFPQMADALLGGHVDMIATIEPFLSSTLEKSGDKLDVVVWLISNVLPNTVIATFNCMQDYIDKNKEAVAAFVRAYDKGVDWARKNKGNDAFVKLVGKYTKLPPSRIHGMKGWPLFPEKVDPKDIDRISTAMNHYGILPKPPNSNTLIYKTARA
jgi:NitT/TauT family transport system substrate-binding protein